MVVKSAVVALIVGPCDHLSSDKINGGSRFSRRGLGSPGMARLVKAGDSTPVKCFCSYFS